ncbi:MAG: methyltransferase domain-containing protein [Acidobacteriaceae bacterium]|nr:methyltransferase domain-containing protein [Acidobacteriaceae bacterium]
MTKSLSHLASNGSASQSALEPLASIEYALLKKLCKREHKVALGEDCQTASYSKLDVHIGPAWREHIRGQIVLDFGCGYGNEMIQLAKAGARKVYGIEISENQLREARQRLAYADVTDRCCLLNEAPPETVDCIFSFDSFEHFEDPAEILQKMRSFLNPGGRVFISFGPTWFHPLGGHAFSAFPWAHVLLCESALVRWRNLYYPGTSVGFNQSGLNRMTIKRFLALCDESGFHVENREIVPIRKLAPLHNRLSREWTTSVVRAVLRK